MHRVCLLVIAAFCFQVGFAIDYQAVEIFGLVNGLPSNRISALHVDAEGMLWVGTPDGLSRFDGYTFYNYHADYSDTTSLPNDNVIDILESADGSLWCITPRGISHFNSSTDNFTSWLIHNHSNAGSGAQVKNVFHDTAEDRIYLLTDRTVYRFDTRGKHLAEIQAIANRLSDTLSAAQYISVDSSGGRLIITGQGFISEWDVESGELLRLLRPDQFRERAPAIITNQQGRYMLAGESRIWIEPNAAGELQPMNLAVRMNSKVFFAEYTADQFIKITDQNKIIWYDPELNIIEQEINIFQHKPHNVTTHAEVMQCGIFWVGTDNGLLKFTDHKNAFRNYSLDELSAAGVPLVSLAYDTRNRLWMGLGNGQVLLLEDPNADKPQITGRVSVPGKISYMTAGEEGSLWVGTNIGFFKVQVSNGRFTANQILNTPVTSLLRFSSDSLLVCNRDSVFWYSLKGNTTYSLSGGRKISGTEIIQVLNYKESVYLVCADKLIEYHPKRNRYQEIIVEEPSKNFLPAITAFIIGNNSKALIGTSDGIFEHQPGRTSVSPLMLHSGTTASHINAFAQDSSGTTWFASNEGLFSIGRGYSGIRKYSVADGLTTVDFSDRVVASSADGSLCFGGRYGFTIFKPDRIPEIACTPTVQIMEARLSGKHGTISWNVEDLDTLIIPPQYRHMKFTFAVLDYWNPAENRIQYSLTKEGKQAVWQPLEAQNFLLVSNLRSGIYRLRVDGTNHNGLLNIPKELVLIVDAPFWQSRLAISSYVVFLVLLFYITIYFSTKQLQKLNKEYRERELIARKIEQQKEELTVQNKNITDSINYAKRIQMALMPSRRLFERYFPDSFILHIPKDIVSGDFYWINEVDGRIYFAAVDCTGHGVPGAFMSIIGFDLFRRITEIEKKKHPAEVLNSLSHGFETIFRDVESITLRDGMDVAFCAIDEKRKLLEFSGAFNPLYLVRDNTITEIKGDRFSVGLNHEEHLINSAFTNHEVPLKDGDIIYIFTDGFADQFGGPEGKKYKYRRFRHLLLALHQLPMNRQVEFLERSIMDWKGELDQVDDILVMGIRITSNKK